MSNHPNQPKQPTVQSPRGSVPLDLTPYYNEALKAWGTDSLPAIDAIPCTVIDSMTRCLGKAHWRKRADGTMTTTITLSRPWFRALRETAGERAMLNQLRETIIHELAHVAIYHRFHSQGKQHPQPHGIEWGRLMSKCGLAPYACATYSGRTKINGTTVTWKEVYDQKCNITKGK